MSHHCEYGVESPLNYPVSDVKVWGRNITYGLYDQRNIGLIPHFDVETLCKYITIKNYTKNYLTAIELQRLNLLVSGFLDFAEFQALEMNPMTMKDWIEALDSQIIAHKRKVLIGKGNISHKQAIEKAEKEFAIYRKREMELLESDFDKEIKRLKNKNDNSSN